MGRGMSFLIFSASREKEWAQYMVASTATLEEDEKIWNAALQILDCRTSVLSCLYIGTGIIKST